MQICKYCKYTCIYIYTNHIISKSSQNSSYTYHYMQPTYRKSHVTQTASNDCYYTYY